MHKLLTPSLLIFALAACSATQTTKNIQTPSSQTISAAQSQVEPIAPALQAIIDQSWQLQLSASPEMAYSMGDTSAAGKLADLSPAALAKLNQGQIAVLAQLKALDRSSLSKEDKINAQILEDQIQNDVDLYRFKDYYLPITAESGFHAYITSIAQGRFNTLEDYRNYIAKLNALPTYFAQQTHWLKQGLAEGITPPKVTLYGFEDSISAYIVPVEKSGYFKPFTQYPSYFTEAQKTQLTQEGRTLVEQKVLPLYQNFYDFMTKEYIPNARENIAASSLPNGAEFYENRVRYYTTLNMTSMQVHELGLKEVQRIRQEMEQIIASVGFKGNFADFLHFLRTDPKFYTTSADQLLKEAAFIAKKADAMLPKYFGKLPRKPYGIAPVPAEIAPKYTTGRYSGSNSDDEPGYYWVNTYALDKRPLYELEALTLHEAVPGHHLQISLNSELTSLPDFRRYSYISAFGEGWGLYSEYLGLEAGFYQDPYSNFGRLTYEMWRAARLVVDTGMHAQGWSRQQAIDFMASNTALSLHNVTTEIDRYISWPGQALSYKIGELTIKRLRAKAEQELGDKFDIRAFHDAVLENGSVPMSILEQQINDFIEAKKVTR
ncbi:DUF885 domain-containing protein [Shewanella putrefaciens]|uniref:DUF885 domain-containing protein n=2 Tax=Shewanella putrefaciens TaxID=24 RepID=A0ABX8XBR0_SHEPU|nr:MULTISPECIES: DUF885 domain-containing protein [Shewanella]ABM22890.1 protein of unknown function DUF885 [Shewanella sp. W3-18-1]AVV84495.1 hypothetical protein SPWS13_2755 [Shewanella putrefaciens]MCT8944570.1 DUF885 domain-containing protein [Shewanella putrefaciens]MDR6965697.1 uncharacterized protein (DUF885 family) [Shewanella putrefaciens]QSE49483.1 DUF885 domain-containing protein [Shewanella putrefaciens]